MTARIPLWTAGPGALLVAGLVGLPWVLSQYGTLLATRMLFLGLLAVSVALLTGIAGLPTLGQTAPFAVGGYTVALLARDGLTVGVAQIAVGAVAGAAFAAVTAGLVVRARGVVVLMITLALGQLTVIAAGRWKSLTGGTDGLVVISSVRPLPGMTELRTDRELYYYALAVTGVLVVALLLALRRTPGTLLRACRDDEARMRASGHPVTGYLTAAYLVAGALAGVAGALLVTTQSYISPADAGFDVAALVLLAVVIGGASSMLGALAGAALVVATRDWFAGDLPGQGPLVLGAMFVTCVYLLPGGVADLLTRLRPRSAR